MDKFNIDKSAIVDLSTSELMYINGGSQQSYNSGYSAGAAFRKYVDAALLEWGALRFLL